MVSDAPFVVSDSPALVSDSPVLVSDSMGTVSDSSLVSDSRVFVSDSRLDADKHGPSLKNALVGAASFYKSMLDMPYSEIRLVASPF